LLLQIQVPDHGLLPVAKDVTVRVDITAFQDQSGSPALSAPRFPGFFRVRPDVGLLRVKVAHHRTISRVQSIDHCSARNARFRDLPCRSPAFLIGPGSRHRVTHARVIPSSIIQRCIPADRVSKSDQKL
jgi:hypothetical protein